MKELDFSPLTLPVTSQEVAEFRRKHGNPPTIATKQKLLVGVLAAAFAFVAIITYVQGTTSGMIVIIAISLITAVLLLIYSMLKNRSTWGTWYKLSRFAIKNGMVFQTNAFPISSPGMLFNVGHGQTVPERISRPDFPYSEVAQYQYTTGSGRNRTVHKWTYLAQRIDRRLPQIILDSKSNNLLGSNLPVSIQPDQELKLEGGFSKDFRLYCPKEYETDALYIFTPDLMAQLMDEATHFDLEIVDNWVFFYANGFLELSSPDVLARCFRILDTVGEKVSERSSKYADSKVKLSTEAEGSSLDSRLSHNIIAPQGERLKVRNLRGIIVFFIAIALLGYAFANGFFETIFK